MNESFTRKGETNLETVKKLNMGYILKPMVSAMIKSIREAPCERHKITFVMPLLDQVFNVEVSLVYGDDCE